MTPPPTPDPCAGNLPLASDLGLHGDRVAIVTATGELTYAALAAQVSAAAGRLGTQRRLVLIAGANTVDAVVAYLGALAGGHVVLLAPGDQPAALESLCAAYDPDVVVRPVVGQWRYEQRRAGSAHVLHPELALLLSTSGSTGSPKLVRLSYANLQSNAESIATYLGIRESDRAATTLPLHYCYGLSVINSHLLRGAGVILTELSVADTCFWDLFRAARGSTFAGVPYTFNLLDRIGFDTMRLPHLRYVTQAGGRLAPERVRHYARLGRRDGWELFVMYGQTEATARIAYLPPELAESNPAAIGVAVPGGTLRLAPLDGADAGTGELVYAGPNVMLGYAESPADLRLGRRVHELHTGDIARRTADGLFEILGRRSRHVKVFGLRIDLQRIEAGLEADGVGAGCVNLDDELVVVAAADGHRADLQRLVAARCGLPVRAVRVVIVPELPRLGSGKIDHRALTGLAAVPGAPAAAAPTTDLCALYAEILDRSDVTGDSTFVGLGGDSLSYVEVSLRLEQTLGRLPAGWHTTPIRQLQASVAADVPTTDAPRRRRFVDTGVALRAAAIVLIVGTHIGVFTVRGGAHLLLAVAGFNFARFHLTGVTRRERTRHVLTSAARIAVPSVVFIAGLTLLTRDYTWANVLLLNEAVGPRTGAAVNFWFIENLVYLLVGLAAVLALPVVDRCERRLPFALPMALLAAALTVRFGVIPVSPWRNLSTPVLLFWLFALGWAIGKAGSTRQRLLVAAAVVGTVSGYFASPLRSAVVVAGLLLLIWLPQLPSTALVNRVAGLLAGSSLYIYLTHWAVYPRLEDHSRALALLASVAAGVLYASAMQWVTTRVAMPRRPVRRAPEMVPAVQHPAVAAGRRPVVGRRQRRPRTGVARRASVSR